MTLENPSFEDVFPIGHVDFPASHVSFSGVVHHPDTSATVFSHGGDIMAFMVSIASRWSLDPFFQGKPRSGVPQDFEAIPCHIWKKYMWCVWKLLREINLMRFFDDVVFFDINCYYSTYADMIRSLVLQTVLALLIMSNYRIYFAIWYSFLFVCPVWRWHNLGPRATVPIVLPSRLFLNYPCSCETCFM